MEKQVIKKLNYSKLNFLELELEALNMSFKKCKNTIFLNKWNF